MELHDLKSDWKAIEADSKDEATLVRMLQENKHPVLKSIRKQILLEITGWVLFLMVYYSMFDGSEKPFWVNLILIISLLLPILHNVYGYYHNRYLTDNSNIKIALVQLYIRIKKFALIAVIARLGFISGLLVFFTYGIQFTMPKYFLLLFTTVIFLIQLRILYRIWIKRIIQIQDCIHTLEEVK
ncbi:hypothetical protein ABS764_11530 [Flavobacterium sp. ST-87]|uniref:Uncharacterized protein n=1 Tax=Flavobacterium plantiphilum TaxID=3163297 RepID=A0ABW8XU96_9FLAO